MMNFVWISWTFFQKSKMKKKNEKRTCQKGLVSGDKNDKRQKKGETHYPLVCGLKKMKTRRESLKEEEEEH